MKLSLKRFEKIKNDLVSATRNDFGGKGLYELLAHIETLEVELADGASKEREGRLKAESEVILLNKKLEEVASILKAMQTVLSIMKL